MKRSLLGWGLALLAFIVLGIIAVALVPRLARFAEREELTPTTGAPG